MSTPTKPKSAKREPIGAVSRETIRQSKVVENHLQLEPDSDAANAATLMLEYLLSIEATRYKRLDSFAFPSHVRAELEPIRKAATQLALLLDQAVLTDQAKLRLPAGVAALHDELRQLVAQCDVSIDATRHEQIGTGAGNMASLRRLRKDAANRVTRSLQEFFAAHATEPADAALQREFVKACLGKVTGSKPRSKSKDLFGR
jgi:hypothetical protein